MKKKNIVLLIITALILIVFAVYSIVKEDLTTVQRIFAGYSETASTEVVSTTEEPKETQILSLDDIANNQEAKSTNETANNGINENETVNNIAVNNVIENYTAKSITINNTSTENNTTTSKEKLPAAGVKTFIIWTIVSLAIISIISNIKYNNIKLK